MHLSVTSVGAVFLRLVLLAVFLQLIWLAVFLLLIWLLVVFVSDIDTGF